MESGSSYRHGVLRCPDCGGALQERAANTATVDVCTDCGGVFIEWFDGAPEHVASGVAVGARAVAAGRGDGCCPVCRVPLLRERYPDEHGVDVARCGECAATFVARSALSAVAAHTERGAPADDASVFDHLRATLRRWFGWDDPSA